MKMERLMEWLKDNKDCIQTGALVLAMFFTALAFFKQRETLQVSVFNDITGRIDHRLEALPSDKNENYKWYITTLNALNKFAFYANHGYLKGEMIEFEKDFIVQECNAISREFPEGREKSRKEGGLEELRMFYEKTAQKEFPF